MNTPSTGRSNSQRNVLFVSALDLGASTNDLRVAAAHAKILGETVGGESKEEEELPFTD